MTLPDTITIDVTLEDITNGTPRDSQSCAVALALKRALGIDQDESASVWVEPSHVDVSNDADEAHYHDGEELTAFIDTFDGYYADIAPRPATFTLHRFTLHRIHEPDYAE